MGAVQKQKPEMIIMLNHKTSLPPRLRLSTLLIGTLYLADFYGGFTDEVPILYYNREL
jgi:hypothetical protein